MKHIMECGHFGHKEASITINVTHTQGAMSFVLVLKSTMTIGKGDGVPW